MIEIWYSLKIFRRNIRKLQEILEEARKHYEERELLFFTSRQELWASELEEGKACPVCGSTTHPHKANLLKMHLQEGNLMKKRQVLS